MISMPKYIPLDVKNLEGSALKYDTNAYQLSDTDFISRHPFLANAEHQFERNAWRDQYGDSTFMPQLQSELLRSGIGSSLGAFGDTGANLAPGSAGEASVARNLGLNILSFQDRNRQNRMASLGAAEGIFPRRQFGLTGQDAVGVLESNNSGQNNWNQANYASQVQQNQFGQQMNAQNKAAQMQLISSIISSIGSVAGAAAGACWVARAVLGTETNLWKYFRYWLFNKAPKWFKKLYLENGEEFSKVVNKRPMLRVALYPFFRLVAEAQRQSLSSSYDTKSVA